LHDTRSRFNLNGEEATAEGVPWTVPAQMRVLSNENGVGSAFFAPPWCAVTSYGSSRHLDGLKIQLL
jgi:hypothetical protein